MKGTPEYDVPVLVVGAGPAGLTAAIELARQGVESLLVERRPRLSDLPRATVVSTRSMELVRSWGLEQEIRAGGVEVEWKMWSCETLALAAAGSALPVGMPSREQSAVVSPTSPACVPQDHVEPVLLGHLQSLGSTRVELATEVVGVESGPDGVRAVLRDVAGGESRVVHARYLVAADGAHSTVRAQLGIPMRGPDQLEESFSVLFRAPLWDLLGDSRYGIYDVTHPEAGGVFLPAGRGDRWLFGQRWQPGRARAADLTKEQLSHLITLGTGVATLRPRIERTGAFTFAAQLAECFRRGSAFLIGDAAHRVTPRGGTGMNSAMHDGFDLGWKLAWVLRGWAEPELLDSYELERRPVVEHNLARSIEPTGSIREVAQELHVDLGDRIAHAWVPSPGGRASTLDLVGSGLTLFTGPESTTWKRAAASVRAPLPLLVRDLDAISARAIGIRGGGALLARPDGAAAAWWPHGTDATPALQAAVSSARAGAGYRGADDAPTARGLPRTRQRLPRPFRARRLWHLPTG